MIFSPSERIARVTRQFSTGVVATTVVLIALAALVIWQATGAIHAHGLDGREDGAVALANTQVLDLTTVDTATAKQKLTRLQARSTGDFGKQISGLSSTFQNVLKRGHIAAKGHIVAAGISSFSDDTATVLVVSATTVTTAKEPHGVKRTYRCRVSLTRESGKWLVNDMKFVS